MRCIARLSQWIGTAAFVYLPPSRVVEPAPPQPTKPARTVLPDIALGKPVKFNMNAMPLGDATTWLSQQFSVPVVLDRRALADAGLQLDLQLTHSKQYKSLKEGLTALLTPAGTAWVALGEMILLTTRERAETILETRAYQRVQPLGGKSPVDSVMRIRPRTWSEVGGPAAVFQFYHVADLTPGGSADTLIGTIQLFVAPTTWTAVGEAGGIAFQPTHGTLEGKQSFTVQRGVEQLLAMREAAGL